MCPIEADWRDRSVGAVAELFDITHLASTNSSLISTVHKDLFNFWNSSQAGDVTVQQLIETLPYFVAPSTILGQHYFIKNDTGALSPVWDSRATPKFKGQKDAVIVAKVLASAPDADPTENVAWLHLGKVSGDIADEVYRTSTVGGVPPSSVSSPLMHRRRFPRLVSWICVLTCFFVLLIFHQCVSGKTKDISLKYASQYWFYGGTSGLGPK